MKLYLFLISLLVVQLCNAQHNDTLSSKNELLIKLVGGLIKENMLADESAKNIKNIFNTSVKEILKKTISKTSSSLMGNSFSFGNAIPFPTELEKNKDAMLENGKGELLNNFHQSLKTAASNAFEKAIPMLVSKAFDFNVDNLIKYANADSLSITDIFKNLNKNSLEKTALPYVKKSLKIAGTSKYFKQLSKIYEKDFNESLKINTDKLISDEIVNKLFNEMNIQEKLIKQNPASLLDKIKKLIDN